MKGTNPNCNLSFIWLIPLIIFSFFFPFLTSASSFLPSFLIPSLYCEVYINNVESFKMREAAAAVKMTFSTKPTNLWMIIWLQTELIPFWSQWKYTWGKWLNQIGTPPESSICSIFTSMWTSWLVLEEFS